MPNLEDIINIASGVEAESKKFSTEVDPDMKALLKTLTSKNITLSQWNAAIKQLGLNVADVRRTYSILKNVAKDLDSNLRTALDVANTYTDKLKYGEVMTNTNAISAIKNGTTIDSFADVETALAGKQATGDYATKTEAQGYATTAKNDVIGTDSDTKDSDTVKGAKKYAYSVAQTAETNAKSHADSVAQTAETNAKSYTAALVSAGWTREIVNALPTPENAKPNAVYMVKRSTGLDTNDVYDEYFLVNVNGVPKLELMGNTELDLSQYTPLGKSSDAPDSKTYYGLSNRIDDIENNIGEGGVDLNGVKEDIAAVEGRVSSVESRVTGIEQYLGGDNFVIDNSVAYAKAVPNNACGKAKILTVGGTPYASENLIPNLHVEKTTVINGITFEKDGIGRVIVNGTATKGTYYMLINYGIHQDKSLAKNAILTGCPSGGSNNTYRLWCSSSDGSSRGDSGKGCEMAAGLLFKDVYIYIGAGYTANNLVFEPKLRYVPLVGNISKVSSIVTYGRNIIPFPYTLPTESTANGVSVYTQIDGSFILHGKPNGDTAFVLYDQPNILPSGITPSKSYVFQNSDTFDASVWQRITWYRSGSVYHSSHRVSRSGVIVCPDDAIGFKLELLLISGKTFNNSHLYIQGHRPYGSDEHTWKPYKEFVKHSYTIPAEVQNLEGYGAYMSDTLYNFIDFTKRRFVKNVVDTTLTGNEPWSKPTAGHMVCPAHAFGGVPDPLYTPITDSAYKCTFNNLLSLDFKVPTSMTIDDWKRYLRENPIRVIAKLANPVLVDVSDILTIDGTVDVEALGAVVFENDQNTPVASSVKYLVTYPKEV